MGVNTVSLTKEIERLVDSYPKISGADSYVSSTVSEAFRKANDHASRMKDKFVSSEHLLMESLIRMIGQLTFLRIME